MIHYFLLPLLLVESTSAYTALNLNSYNRKPLSQILAAKSTSLRVLSGSSNICSTQSDDSVLSTDNRDAVTSPIRESGASSSSSSSKLNKALYRRNTALFCTPSGTSAESFTAETERETETEINSNSNLQETTSSVNIVDSGDNTLHEIENIGHHVQQHLILDHTKSLETDSIVSLTTPLIVDKIDTEITQIAEITDAKLPHLIEFSKIDPPVIIEKKPTEGALKKFLKGNWLVIGEMCVIMIAKMNPAFGATGGRLKPEFFISKLGVFTIFFINGIALSIGKN